MRRSHGVVDEPQRPANGKTASVAPAKRLVSAAPPRTSSEEGYAPREPRALLQGAEKHENFRLQQRLRWQPSSPRQIGGLEPMSRCGRSKKKKKKKKKKKMLK